MIKVSIIVPVYNTPEQYLRECIESILSQTLVDFELICIDDASTDSSLSVLKEYAQKDSRVIVMVQDQNGGVAKARNRGLKEAKGEYLYFLDCDDFIEPHAMETLYRVSQEKQLDVLLFSSEYFYENQQLSKDFFHNSTYLTYDHRENHVRTGREMFQFLKEKDSYYNVIWIQFYKSSFLYENQFSFCPQTGTCDDALFSFMTMHRAKRLTFLSEILHHYRIRDNSGDTKPKTTTYIQWMIHWYQKMILWFIEEEMEDVALYRRHFLSLRRQIVQTHWSITQKDSVLLEETLLNSEHQLFGEPLEALEKVEFMDHLDTCSTYCCFGAGVAGKRTIALLQRMNVPLPKAICDNNKDLQGTTLYGIPVISFEKAMEQYDNLHILITNHYYSEEIYEQVSKKIEKEKISRLFLL